MRDVRVENLDEQTIHVVSLDAVPTASDVIHEGSNGRRLAKDTAACVRAGLDLGDVQDNVKDDQSHAQIEEDQGVGATARLSTKARRIY